MDLFEALDNFKNSAKTVITVVIVAVMILSCPVSMALIHHTSTKGVIEEDL